MATQTITYSGIVPNRAADSPTNFATNVYDYQVWINNFVPSFNTAIDSINTDLTTMSGYVSTTLGYKNTTESLKNQTQAIADIVADTANYKGDWVSGYNTTGYPTGASVSYTDGNMYYSKSANNLAEPTAGTSTADWYFAGRKDFVYVSKNANYTAVTKDFIYADTSTASFTITLPATPLANDVIAILDNTSSFDTNPLVIARNGNSIMGLAEDMIVNTKNVSLELIFNGTEWRIK